MQVRRLREDELYHHGVKGQRWGIRRYQNPDGSLTEAGKRRYLNPDGSYNEKYRNEVSSRQKQQINKKQTNYSDAELKRKRTAALVATVGAAAVGNVLLKSARSGAINKGVSSAVQRALDHSKDIKVSAAVDGHKVKAVMETARAARPASDAALKSAAQIATYGGIAGLSVAGTYLGARKFGQYNGALARRERKRKQQQNNQVKR